MSDNQIQLVGWREIEEDMKYLDIVKLPSGRYSVSDGATTAKGDTVAQALRNYADMLDTMHDWLKQYENSTSNKIVETVGDYQEEVANNE